MHLLPIKKTPISPRQVPHFRLWFDPFPILSVQSAGEAQYWLQNLRTQNTRAPCHERQQNRALSPGKARRFLWDWLGVSGGKGTSAELWVSTQSSCPIFQSTVPVVHGSVSFLFLRADFAKFSLQSGNIYYWICWKCCFADYRKAQTTAYIQPITRTKRVAGKDKENVSYQLGQPESLSSYLNTLKENPESKSSLKCSFHFRYRKKLNRCFILCVSVYVCVCVYGTQTHVVATPTPYSRLNQWHVIKIFKNFP